jgi:hypothetical protein
MTDKTRFQNANRKFFMNYYTISKGYLTTGNISHLQIHY